MLQMQRCHAEKSFSVYRGHAQNAELSCSKWGEVVLKMHKLHMHRINAETQCLKTETLCLNAETLQATCGSLCATN